LLPAFRLIGGAYGNLAMRIACGRDAPVYAAQTPGCRVSGPHSPYPEKPAMYGATRARHRLVSVGGLEGS
jgi:hypothetical protein